MSFNWQYLNSKWIPTIWSDSQKLFVKVKKGTWVPILKTWRVTCIPEGKGIDLRNRKLASRAIFYKQLNSSKKASTDTEDELNAIVREQ